jgi:hypothetical protein
VLSIDHSRSADNLVQHMTDYKPDRVELNRSRYIQLMMADLIHSLTLVAIGFVTIFDAMKSPWRMGKMVGMRGEKQLLGGWPKMMMSDLTSVIAGSTILLVYLLQLPFADPTALLP